MEPNLRLEGRSYCKQGCWEEAATREFQRLLSRARAGNPVPHRMPLGLLLLSQGSLTDVQLRHALELQRESGSGRLGDWLIELGYVPEEKVTAALSMQWGCPVYPMQSGNISVATEFLPKTLMETGRVVPLHVQADQKVAYLAFLDRVDYTLLYSIERMTGYRTMPCVASPSRLRQTLVKLRSSSRTREVVFDAAMAAVDMARIARNYGDAVGARDVSIARCAEFIWVRCSRASGATDLLFRAGEVMPSASLD